MKYRHFMSGTKFITPNNKHTRDKQQEGTELAANTNSEKAEGFFVISLPLSLKIYISAFSNILSQLISPDSESYSSLCKFRLRNSLRKVDSKQVVSLSLFFFLVQLQQSVHC